MYKNYFYLLRAINDLIPLLVNCSITEIYTQEKNTLFFKIPTEEFPNRHLLISANPNSPYLIIKNNHNKAKKNVIEFFQELNFKKIISIGICDHDRIIKIGINNSNLFFTIEGNKTNIYSVENNGNIESFKKTSVNDFQNLISQNYFYGNTHPIIFNDGYNYKDIKDLKSKYPMVSSEIKNEILFRMSLGNNNKILKLFKDIVTEMLNNPIRIGFNSDLSKIIFVPNSFRSIIVEKNYKDFENLNDALHYYFTVYYQLEYKTNYQKELEKFFDKELNKIAVKLNNLKGRIEKGSKENLYYEYGNLLLANIYLLKKGLTHIKLKTFDQQNEYIIKLDPKLPPKKNVDKYFEKAKDEKVNFNKSTQLFKLTQQKHEELTEEYKKFKNAESADEISKIYKSIIPKKQEIIKMDSGLKFKYWQYKIDDKYDCFIGRDSKSNDYLSIKFAKQNDYWFHARGLPGSHVVLRVENVKEGIPKDVVKKAASLAAFYSKAKTAGTAPVSYTFAKFVYKKKGMEPGKVLLTKEKTLLVKPEIPNNCVLDNE